MSSDNAGEKFDPNKLCEEFVQIASSNSAEAAMYLQENDWNLEQALNAFFSSSAAGGPPDIVTLDDSVDITPPRKKMKIADTSDQTSSSKTLEKTSDNSHASHTFPAASSPSPATSSSSSDISLAHHAISSSIRNPTQTSDTSLKSVSLNKEVSPASTSGNKMTGEDNTAITDKDLNRIRVLSWNIDGLDANNKRTRTRAACTEMIKMNPDVIFLQEVVPDTLETLSELFPESSYCTFPADQHGYFTTIIINKKTVWVDETDIYPFYSSTMGRKLQHAKVNIKGIDFTLFTTHLESTASHQKERLKQLNQIFVKVRETESSQNVLVGGDLNLGKRDSITLPEKTVDIWEVTGKRKESEWTWDTTKNDNVSASFKAKCRFDRFFFRPEQSNQVKPIYFELVGLQKVPSCNRFPSDHWGILAHFEINQKLPVLR